MKFFSSISITAILLFAITACGQTLSHEQAMSKYELGDYQAAHDIWLALAEKGDAQAQYHLAKLYESEKDRMVPQSR